MVYSAPTNHSLGLPIPAPIENFDGNVRLVCFNPNASRSVSNEFNSNSVPVLELIEIVEKVL